VNDDAYLRDASGGRRFWPVRCGRIDIEALAVSRDQLWAEAVHRYRAGERWWLDRPDLVEAATGEQASRLQRDAWEDRIAEWLEFETREEEHGYGQPLLRRIRRSDPISDTTIGEILEKALGIEPARWTQSDQNRVSHCLRARGWTRYQRRDGPRREWRWREGGPLRPGECHLATIV
jgi:putative DNA primase/helicase